MCTTGRGLWCPWLTMQQKRSFIQKIHVVKLMFSFQKLLVCVREKDDG